MPKRRGAHRTGSFADEGGCPLGTWLTRQRHLHTTGALDTARTAALQRLDIIWNPCAWASGSTTPAAAETA
ncbi:helicase associated domain-containing protein [Streptomyces sp. NBC_00191]|uniref:helicase associated domain-containing protein n=1 Tax=Streptomyces sp. NBC_00191 TaxID=2975674 RepID=UPI003243F225